LRTEVALIAHTAQFECRLRCFFPALWGCASQSCAVALQFVATELFGFIGLFGLNKKAWAAKHAKEASAARKRALSSQK